MPGQVTRVFGADAPALVRALSAAVREHRRAQGPLAPVEVIAPTRALRTWLQLELAALDGGAVNVSVRPPASLLGEAGHRSRIAAIYEFLGDDGRLSLPRFGALRSYIEREAPPARRALRRYELSASIAHVFGDYLAHARHLLARWEAGGEAPTEAWQAELWRWLGERAPAPPASDESLQGERPLFVFDLPLPGEDLLAAVRARPGPVTVLQRHTVEPAGADPWRHHGALGALGRRRWEAAVQVVDASAPADFTAPLPPVEFLGANSDRRLCEGAVATAWRWLRDGSITPPLRFHEVAFVVPDSRRDSLVPLLDEVMREAHGLRRVFWNLPSGSQHDTVQLARALLDLPATPLRRADIVSILRHPVMQKAFEGAFPEDWAEWLDAVGVFHGLDGASLGDTYLKHANAVHWDQGLTRLALGAFMGGERSGPPAALELPSGARFVPEERTQSAQEGLGTLLGLVRSLLSDAAGIGEGLYSLDRWRVLLREYLSAYVLPVGPGDARARGAVLRALDEGLSGGIAEPVPFVVVQRMVGAALDAISLDLGGHLSQGVVVGAATELAGIPFRGLVFLGLEEGSFPSLPKRSELDLRPPLEREESDRRRHETSAFFTLLHDTRERACLAFLAHDPITGEAKSPSFLVDDLRAHHPQAQPPRAPSLLAPFRADDVGVGPLGEAVAWAFPEAKAEHQVADLGRSWRALHGDDARLSALPGGWSDFLGTSAPPPASPPASPVVDVRLDTLALFLRCPAQGYARQVLGLRGLDEGRDELIDEPFETSPLVEAQLFKEVIYRLGTEVPGHRLEAPPARAQAIAGLYGEVVGRLSQGGLLPVGYFQSLQARRDVQCLSAAVDELFGEVADRTRLQGRRIRWGGATTLSASVVEPQPPLEFTVMVDGAARAVRLVGESGLLFDGGSLDVRFQRSAKDAVPPPWKSAAAKRELLGSWVEHLALQASGLRAERRARVLVSEGVAHGATFGDMAPGTARDLLGELVEAVLSSRVGYRAPAVAYFREWASLDPGRPAVERLDAFRAACSEAYEGSTPIEDLRFSALREVELLPDPDLAQLERHRRLIQPFEAHLAAEAPAGRTS